MELKNLIASLKKTIVLIWDKTTRRMFHSKKYLRFILGYFQTSETIFLLFFATLIGVGAGFGAIIFRWMITFFQNLFFTQGQHTLAFLGSYYVIIIPAIGGVIVGLIVYFFAREAKGHGVPEVMLAVAIGGSRIRPRVAAHDIGRIPVIENNDTGKLIGLITRKNIISTYNKALKN